jgi:hypothetical protein
MTQDPGKFYVKCLRDAGVSQISQVASNLDHSTPSLTETIGSLETLTGLKKAAAELEVKP